MSNQALLAFLSSSQKQSVTGEERIRQRLSEKFGVDFSGLKITKDAALEDVQELAYTRGNEIHLAPNVDPASPEGQQILTHEAAHVIQQGTRTLPGGMLHDQSMEAQANDIARGVGQIDVSGFSMPTATGAPVQGFLDFIFNREKYKENKRNQLIQKAKYLNMQIQGGEKDPKFARDMGKVLKSYGFGDTAIYDPQKHRKMFRDATKSEDGIYRWIDSNGSNKTTQDFHLEREIFGLPNEEIGNVNNNSKVANRNGSNKSNDIMRLYGISQKDLDAIMSLDPEANRRLIEKSNRATNILASKDWVSLSDEDFIKNLTKLHALSRLNVVAVQGTGAVGMDKKLAQKPENKDLLDEHQDTADYVNALMSYAKFRIAGIANQDESAASAAESFVDSVQMFRKQFNERHAAREAKKPGLLNSILNMFKRR